MKLTKYLLAVAILWVSLFSISPALATTTDPTIEGLTKTVSGVSLYNSQYQQEKASIRTMLLNRVGGVVGLILSFVGVIFLILTIYAGIMWMTAQGNSSQVEKAKDLLINAVIGLVIITAAYSITTFVGQNLAK